MMELWRWDWKDKQDQNPRIHPLRAQALRQRIAERLFAAVECFYNGGIDDDAAAEQGLEEMWEAYIDLKILRLPPISQKTAPLFDDGMVRAIRWMLRSQSQCAIANRLGVAQSVICAIAHGKTYAHVED